MQCLVLSREDAAVKTLKERAEKEVEAREAQEKNILLQNVWVKTERQRRPQECNYTKGAAGFSGLVCP